MNIHNHPADVTGQTVKLKYSAGFETLEAWNKFANAAASIWALLQPRKGLILTICALSVLAAGIGKSIVGSSYTSTVVIQPDLRGPESPSKSAPVQSVDVILLVESQTKIVQSPALLRRVVQRLGLDQEPTSLPFATRVMRKIKGLLGVVPQSALDVATSDLLSKINIYNEKRSYLIYVQYTASTPQKALAVVNAIASEFVHNARQQRLSDRYAYADRALTDLQLTYGERHPAIQRARNDVALARAALDSEAANTSLMDERELDASGMVIAKPTTQPSGLTISTVLILGMVGGLLFALTLIAYLERRALLAIFARLDLLHNAG